MYSWMAYKLFLSLIAFLAKAIPAKNDSNQFLTVLSCDFDNATFCGWENDVTGRAQFLWQIWEGQTPSKRTGPLSDVSGNGKYVYAEASCCQHGDKARLVSARIRGRACMSFMYHMYGGNMGSLVIYTNTNETSETVEWIKTGNHRNQWMEALVFFNYTEKYRVVIESVRGASWSSDVAIDEIKFQNGSCHRLVSQTLHAFVKEGATDFKLDRAPAHGGWTYQFTLHVPQTKNRDAHVMYFVYPVDGGCSTKRVSRELSLHGIPCVPIDFFYASGTYRANLRKVLLINRGSEVPQGLALASYQPCCEQSIHGFFYTNVSFKELSKCPPGWRSVQDYCLQIHLNPGKRWVEARRECLIHGGKLAVLREGENFDELMTFLEDFNQESVRLYVGGFAASEGKWISVKTELFPTKTSLWGPHEPSGDGWCGSLALGEKWNPIWKGKGWRINDRPCLVAMGWICQKEKQSSSVKCDKGWFEVESSCFEINPYHEQATWDKARHHCLQQGGDLAIIDSEAIRTSVDKMLTSINNHKPGDTVEFFIGIKKLGKWQWLGGGNISETMWKTGFPDTLKSGECAALVKTSLGWRIVQRSCFYDSSFICETTQRNYAYAQPTIYSGKAAAGEPFHMVDGNIASCFSITPISGQRTWWSITLKNKSFLYKVTIKNRPDCCFGELPQFKVNLGDGVNMLTPHCKAYDWKALNKRLVICEPTIMATNVTLLVEKGNKLTLCEVMITATDDKNTAHGVQQELWFQIPSGTVASLLADSRYPSNPDAVNRIDNFDSPFGMHKDYGQRLTAYIQVPESGNYTFYVACDDVCELWLNTDDLRPLGSQTDGEEGKVLLAKLEGAQWTDHNQWEKFPALQTSRETWLSNCRFYYMEALMKQSGVKDCLSVGMRLPNGTYERPITGQHLYWIRPGTSYVDFKISSFAKVVKIETGQPLVIQASYKYCCQGVYCPGCLVHIYLRFAEQTFLVHDGLPMTCQEHQFNQTVETSLQAGIYAINITYGSMDFMVEEEIGTVHITAIQIEACDFTSDFCSWDNKDNTWKLSGEEESLLDRKQFTFVMDTKVAVLESPLIQANSLQSRTGLCLTFLYLLRIPTNSESSIEVLMLSSSNSSIWYIQGYQGNTWSVGQVSFTTDQDIKVAVVVETKGKDTINVAIDSISISTKHCHRSPVHSLPGYKCANQDQFQCDNGECVSKNLVCDGDPACTDQSDENNCKCLINQFVCPTAECLSESKLCDNIRDCSDGTDEAKCDTECPEDSYSCTGGSCVPWALTCDGTKHCEDGSDEPPICGRASGSSRCPLVNLSCRSSNYTDISRPRPCQGNRVSCSFEDGLCGLKHDSQFHWSIGSGETPTKETGPSYDHTTLQPTGKYLFLEASARQKGESAVLKSESIDVGQDTCVQFWYHMKGRDIGSLNIYIQNNVTKRLVWSQNGEKGNTWLFGQVGDKDDSYNYKIMLEGVVGSGIHGDIAIDDLTLLNGKCCKKYGDESLGCLFELEMCDWTSSEKWQLSKLAPLTFLAKDWQQTSGGFAYFKDCSFQTGNRQACYANLKSPIIRAVDGWNCMQFWYYLANNWYSSLEVSIEFLNERNITELKMVWISTSDYIKTGIWSHARVPLDLHVTVYKVLIEGRKSSRRAIIALDDISFQTEKCQPIPWKESNNDFGINPLNATHFWKLDGSDKDVRLQGSAQYIIEDTFTVLYLDGQTAYAEVPAVPLRKSSFTIACRIKIIVMDKLMHIVSDWMPPYQFRMYIYSDVMYVELRKKGHVEILLQMYSDRYISSNTWVHLAFTWDRTTREGKLYFDGSPVGSAISTYRGEDIDLNLTNHTTYEIGYKKDTGEKLKGLLRDLIIFLRPLTHGEVFALFRPSRALCSVRRTTNDKCCVFPFKYKKQRYSTCTSVDHGFLWCATSSSFENDSLWGWCNPNDACLSFKGDFCGWDNTITTTPQWKLESQQEMQSMAIRAATYVIEKGWRFSSGSKEGDYQLNFATDHKGYVNITDLPDLWAFTICFWMKTADNSTAGTPIWYRVRYENKGKEVTAIALVDYRGFYVYVGEVSSKRTNVAGNDAKWHHVCLMWTSEGGRISLHYDKRTLEGDGFAAGEKIPGGGDFIVGLTKEQVVLDPLAGEFIGSISHVHVFSKALGQAVVNWMLHGCGGIIFNAIVPWSKFSDCFVGNVTIQRPAQCADVEGYRFVVHTNISKSSHRSVIDSPFYERSSEGYSTCVRFRYIIYGPGAQELRLYQQFSNLINQSRRLMWVDNESNQTEMFWKYGRIALPSGVRHKISFEAVMGTEPCYVGIRGLQVTPGYCPPAPLQSTQECGQNFSRPLGYIYSPFHPGYYTPLTRCRWTIAVPSGHVIRLHFIEFHLEDHPLCQNDYLEVYDGSSKSLMGKYCGDRYPDFLESSLNTMELFFVTNEKVTRSGFKLYYTSRKVGAEERDCIRFEGCPSSCECNAISRKNNEVLVSPKKGVQLTAVPFKIPSHTVMILFQENKISYLPDDTFGYLQKLKYLDLSRNHIFRIKKSAFGNLTTLETLRLSSNFIQRLPEGIFNFMTKLQSLDLSSNLIEEIPANLLSALMSLKTLSLRQNRIKKLARDAFNGTKTIQYLYLQQNHLTYLPDDAFAGLSTLKVLYLNDNKLQRLSSRTFRGLISLEKLYLQNNSYILKDFAPDVFDGLFSLKELHLDDFILCCYAEKAIPEVRCLSPKDEFSSCADLMKNKGIQVCVWILGLSALIGNLFVIIMRVMAKEDNKVHSFLLTNLAVADLLMGVYLLIIAAKDRAWQGEYFKHDIEWRSGRTCEFTGGLSMLSSEVSVLMLTLITTDRLICIVFPFRIKRIGLKLAYVIVTAIWVFGIVVSIIPILAIDYFYDSKRQVGFYGKSAVCLPLQLSAEKQAGWEYAVAIFIALNFASFLYIVVVYVAMFITVKQMSRRVRSTNVNRESQMAKRLVFIILTDLLCWMPVIIIGLLSILDKFHDPEKDAYVWIAVFVLPVNSSINPILYTFSTPLVKRKLREKTEGWSSLLERSIGQPNSSKGSQARTLLALPRRNMVAPSNSRRGAVVTTPSTSASPCTSDRQLDEIPDCRSPDIKLNLVETLNIFPGETSYAVGFIVARTERRRVISVRLIKHFSKAKENDWKKETELVMQLNSERGHPNIVKYCWHSRAEECCFHHKRKRFPRLRKAAFFLCYEYVSSTTLEAFLADSNLTLNPDVLFVVAIDLIYAIQFLEQKGIVHNNIKTSNVLIGRGLRRPPITAVLGGFSGAQQISRDFPSEYEKNDHSIKDLLGKNVLQFGFVLAELIKSCQDAAELAELDDVMHLCFEQDPDVRPTAQQVRNLLEELWFRTDIWDTSL